LSLRLQEKEVGEAKSINSAEAKAGSTACCLKEGLVCALTFKKLLSIYTKITVWEECIACYCCRRGWLLFPDVVLFCLFVF